MSTDERSESLAAQAAAWVPPWERQRPDAAAADAAPATERPGDPTAPAEPSSGDTARADDAAILPTDADGVETDPETDADAGPDTEIDPVPPELAPIPGEVTGPVTVDAPQVLPGEREPEPTDVGVPPELPVPGALEAAEEADPDRSEPGSPVDAPTPFGPDDDAVADDDDPSAPAPADHAAVGVDAGAGAEDDAAVDAFAADHDISDDGRADQPLSSEVSADAVIPPGAVSPPGEPDPDTPGGSGGAPAPFGMFPQGGRRAGTAAPAPAPRRGTPRTTVPGAEADAGTESAPTIDDTELRAALEAVLLVVDEPVAEMQLAQIMEQPTERVAAMLEDISAGYTAAGHGFDLRRAAGGWRLYTRTEYAAYVERFVLDGQSVRLTQAALETLAVIAYKQPVTRSRISVIRGVNCDGVMRTLVTRGLIEECGTESETGAFLYRTTVLFLEKLGLNSVDQLPPLAPFLPDDVEEVIDAQR